MRGTLKVTQIACIDRQVDTFDVSLSSPTPALTFASMRSRGKEEERLEGPYREAVGAGLPRIISNSTRPDISNAVCEVVR